MNSSHCHLWGKILIVVAVMLPPLGTSAQTAATAAVRGRIFNPLTGEYVRNAQVRADGTTQVTTSEDGGHYVLEQLTPDTVVVSFTGYRELRTTLTLAPGSVTERNFELVSDLWDVATNGRVVKLQQFIVSSSREGSAKAIMEQRRSMNITNSVGSEEFGDVAEGNIAEFLKNMPGIEIEFANSEPRYARLHGLGPHYTQVTLDGVSLASADANVAASARAVSSSIPMSSSTSASAWCST